MLKLVTMVLTLAGSAAVAEQRDCLFERHSSPEGTFDINLPISIITRAAKTAVAVHPTRMTYDTKATRGANGSAEYAFVTEVSREVITVAPQGEAFWQVTFTEGRTSMHFLGKCAPARG